MSRLYNVSKFCTTLWFNENFAKILQDYINQSNIFLKIIYTY